MILRDTLLSRPRGTPVEFSPSGALVETSERNTDRILQHLTDEILQYLTDRILQYPSDEVLQDTPVSR
jgi:hypothetical protein